MYVKTFEGVSLKDVMRTIKKEFGREAVILETREKTIADTSAKMVEVKAAVPEPPKVQGAILANNSTSTRLNEEFLEQFQYLQSMLQNAQQGMANKQNIRDIQDELKDLKLILIDSLRSKSHAQTMDLPTFLTPIYQQLILTGVHHPNLIEVMNHLKSLPAFGQGDTKDYDSATEYYRSHAIRFMLKKVQIFPSILINKGQPIVHGLIGPAGSGKTSTLVKLAAYFQKKAKANVLLAAFDSMRLAASEPLRVYSKVLSVPFVSLKEPKDLTDALAKHRDIDLVLVDTYGCYPKGESELQTLKALKGSTLPVDYHLVLALTEKDLQLERAVSAFSPLGLSSLLFTKLDDSWTYGDIYNLSHKWSIPLSFFSTGPQVPQDLERATRERVMERMFGL